MKTWKKWSDLDRDFLKENYIQKTFAEIGAILGGRSRRAVQAEAIKLGLPSKLSVIPSTLKKSRYLAHDSWLSMKNRCHNPDHPEWKNYGGRGICVCDRWVNFFNFLSDMGERPRGYSIDRIDPNGNYEPSNCKWIPKSDQAKTTRKHLSVGPCRICNERIGNISGGRCFRCYDYVRRTGRERPFGADLRKRQ